MAISYRDRKRLWARSGNRCAFCRRLLIMSSRAGVSDAIIGDECHIMGRRGPRTMPELTGAVDSYDNLILLCKVDHKRMDDQPDIFTVDRIRALKVAHELWVEAALDKLASPHAETAHVSPLDSTSTRKVRFSHVLSGGELLRLAGQAHGYNFEHDELHNDNEVDLVTTFLHDITRIVGLDGERAPPDDVAGRYRLNARIEALYAAGFIVYGGHFVKKHSDTGVEAAITLLAIRVMRMSNPQIQEVLRRSREAIEE